MKNDGKLDEIFELLCNRSVTSVSACAMYARPEWLSSTGKPASASAVRTAANCFASVTTCTAMPQITSNSQPRLQSKPGLNGCVQHERGEDICETVEHGCQCKSGVTGTWLEALQQLLSRNTASVHLDITQWHDAQVSEDMCTHLEAQLWIALLIFRVQRLYVICTSIHGSIKHLQRDSPHEPCLYIVRAATTCDSAGTVPAGSIHLEHSAAMHTSACCMRYCCMC